MKNENVIKLFEMMKNDEEMLQSNVYESISLTDYDSFTTAFSEIIEAYERQEVYMYIDEQWDEYVFTKAEKFQALVLFLEYTIENIKKNILK